ncbi:MAG TPA: alpha-L-arabinofuranosidase C-terminal domain-containing protein [Verrucomicrobiae bacterium]|jgi:alpha-N-arabinofuranosidase|nr:alpha-L-arabinofuranosidase C-terminal domain-containing protein [Verrucomicrobiae bacterium]
MTRLFPALPIMLALSVTSVIGGSALISIDEEQAVGNVNPHFYGLMTEEINHSYDGGLYAELVQNRAFLDNSDRPLHWSAVQGPGAAATITLDHATPLSGVLTNSLRLDATAASESGRTGIANNGYWGIPVKPRTKYRASFYARTAPEFKGPVRIAIESDDGATTFAEAKVSRVGGEWKRYTATLKTGDAPPTAKTRLVLSISQPGTVWFDLVSLFPPTFHNRPNGNRVDIMEMLAGMKPGFLRFPGGNYVEGDTLESRFDWKKTIGPLTDRPGHACCWGYRSSDGMGLLEFLEWCEDLKMEPVLAVYAGYNLNHSHIDAGPALQPYVQDALDEIEYVTGDTGTKWGAARAKDGHRAPFKLAYVEIGNEDWFDGSGSYDARFAQFYDTIKAKYPNLKCISTVGTEHPADQRVHSRKPDVIDEHYYSPAATYDQDSPTHWDNYDRTGPKVFVGEWAAYEDVKPWEPPSGKLPPTPNLKAAVADAAWMCGMERNADLIVMQCYAPLFVNVNRGARQWRPDLIGYNGLNVYGSPSYYAIQMFSQNRGDSVLKTSVSDSSLNYSVTKNFQNGDVYVKVANPESTAKPVEIKLNGRESIAPEGTATTLSASSLSESNSIDDPVHVVPVTTAVTNVTADFTYTFAPYSVTVLRLDTGSVP